MTAQTYAVVQTSGLSRTYWLATVIDLGGRRYAMPLPDGSGYSWSELQFKSKDKARKAARALGDVLPEIFVQDFTARHCFAIKVLEAK